MRKGTNSIVDKVKARVVRIQELRRSNAATKIPSGKTYNRTVKHRKQEDQ